MTNADGGPARIGIVDTTFARVDMGTEAVRALHTLGTGFLTIRRTVPGVKDLPVACKRLIEQDGCDIVMALGMPGSKPIDKTCAHEATQGLIQCQLMTNTHIVEVFVHEDEATSVRELEALMLQRTRDHARSTYDLLFQPEALVARAGSGTRQGHDDVGSTTNPNIKWMQSSARQTGAKGATQVHGSPASTSGGAKH